MLTKIKIVTLRCDHVTVLPDNTEQACRRSEIIECKSFSDIKRNGWALCAGGKCYCPEHAPFYRNVGRPGKPRKHVQIRLEGVDGRRK